MAPRVRGVIQRKEEDGSGDANHDIWPWSHCCFQWGHTNPSPQHDFQQQHLRGVLTSRYRHRVGALQFSLLPWAQSSLPFYFLLIYRYLGAGLLGPRFLSLILLRYYFSPCFATLCWRLPAFIFLPKLQPTWHSLLWYLRVPVSPVCQSCRSFLQNLLFLSHGTTIHPITQTLIITLSSIPQLQPITTSWLS